MTPDDLDAIRRDAIRDRYQDRGDEDAAVVFVLLDEVERLRDGIAEHRERCDSMQEAVGGPHAPQDEALWSLLDGGDQ